MSERDERIGAWINLVQVDRVVQESLGQRLEDGVGVSLAEHELLWRLAASPERKERMNDLSRLMLLSKSGVTRLVDRLEREKLVARGSCETDRRVVYAQITNAGQRILAKAQPIFDAELETSFSRHLNDVDLRTLRRALRKLLEGNDAWQDERCQPTLEMPAVV